MGYILGIDIGIASVGFAAVDLDQKAILCSGVHIFEAAENPKDGSSLATPRREKRGMRRVIRRRAQRKSQIRQLFLKHDLNCLEAIDKKYTKSGKGIPPVSPWDLRKAGLERKLTDEEFVKTLFHIANHRGFQSNRKGGDEPNDTDGKKALSGAKELQDRMIRAGTRTIGAFLADQPKKRNGDGSYENFITRSLLREEIKALFQEQRKFGNTKATDVLRDEFSEIAFFQRPLQSSEHMVGKCSFETGENRAPKFSYTAELFVVWSKLNNCRIKSVNSEERPLTQDEKNRLSDLAHKNKSGVSYTQARKELALSDDERFNIGYRRIDDKDNSWEKIRNAAEKPAANFLKLSGYHALKDALATGSNVDWQRWAGPDRDKLDDMARIISFYEDAKEVHAMLSLHALDDEQIKRLSSITNFSKTIDISLKAARKILPEMQKGLTYDKACEAAGYNFNRKENKGLKKLPPFEDVRNPVVNRALAQARKVINAVIREYEMPDTIVIELAREVGKNYKDRKDIERQHKQNESYRSEAKKHVAEILGIIEDNVSGEDILKYRLWKEQDGFCPYSGAYISPESLRDPVATQIDHIIPYSRSWDDSYMNKILCRSDENQKKGNQTPYEYLKDKTWDAVTAYAARLPHKKAERLLTENFDEKKAGEWKDRALNDTRYMARLLKNHLEQSLNLGKGNRIQTRNGSLTAHLRGAWGFAKKNRENDRHHALDAIVIASSTPGMVQELSNWNKYEARRKNPSERVLPPAPWESFHKDALTSVDKIFVSRMPVRKITGAAHEETIRSIRGSGKDRQIIQRIKLKSLSVVNLENLVDKERNIKLYNVLKERLEQYNGKADKAFIEPIFMPSNDASKLGPRINSIRVVTNEKSGIEVNEGLASNGDQIRIDVFKRNNEFFLIPIYVHQFAEKSLPDRAIIQGKDEKDWVVMTDDEFLFSLYKNDLIRIKPRNGESYFAYYVGTVDRSTGNISIRAHDSDPSFGKDGKTRAGVKTALSFEKYSVDYFGNTHQILKEPRLGVAHPDDSEPGETVSREESTAAAE